MQNFTDTVTLDLQPGRVYFLRPDWQQLQGRRLAIKMEILARLTMRTCEPD